MSGVIPQSNSGSGGITALTGDVSASGSGSVVATLSTVNSNVGTFGNATNVAQITANAKGLITAISNVAISGGTPGGSTKQVQYNNAGAFGGATGFEYGNTNNDVLITAQASTSVPLNLKGAAAQSANLLNVSSSAGTADLASISSAGYLQAIRVGAGAAPTSFNLYVEKNTGSDDLVRFNSTGNYGMLSMNGVVGTWTKYIVNGSIRFNLKVENIGGGSLADYVIQDASGNNVFYIDGNTNYIALNYRFLKKQGADVASAAGAITLGGDGNVFEITGTSSITLIANTSWQNGSEITLVFSSTATLVNGTANSGTNIGFQLAGAVDFVATANDSISLTLCEIGGTQRWVEKCRSVN